VLYATVEFKGVDWKNVRGLPIELKDKKGKLWLAF
jgi:hypothetical protein